MGKIANSVLALYAIVVILFLLLPVLIILPMSFNDGAIFEVIPSKPSLVQYARLFSNPSWMDVLWRSVQIAASVMILANIVGTLAALGIHRSPKSIQPMLEAFFLAPQVVPSVVLASSSYYVFVQLRLIGSSAGIAIMHTLIALPFVVILVQTRLKSLGPDLAQASASLGANPLRTFWHVTLPQLRLTLIGAAVIAFHVSFDEVVLALFLSGTRNKTLPVKLWETILFEVSPDLPAVSAVIILLPILIVLPVMLLQGRTRAKGVSVRT